MIAFLSKSFAFVAVFSVIRFLLGTYFASFIFPTDYAVILLPMLMFAFIDIYIEGGYIAAIIKLGVKKEQKAQVRFNQLKNFMLLAPLLILFFLLYDEYHEDKLLPIWVVLNYCFISLVKVYSYVREGILVAKGKYVLVETLSFIVSMVTYAFIFFLIFNTNLPGYYLLCLLHSIFVVIYTLLIFYFSRGLDFEKGSPMQIVNQLQTLTGMFLWFLP